MDWATFPCLWRCVLYKTDNEHLLKRAYSKPDIHGSTWKHKGSGLIWHCCTSNLWCGSDLIWNLLYQNICCDTTVLVKRMQSINTAYQDTVTWYIKQIAHVAVTDEEISSALRRCSIGHCKRLRQTVTQKSKSVAYCISPVANAVWALVRNTYVPFQWIYHLWTPLSIRKSSGVITDRFQVRNKYSTCTNYLAHFFVWIISGLDQRLSVWGRNGSSVKD